MEKRILILGAGIDMEDFMAKNAETLSKLDEVITEAEAIKRGYYNPAKDIDMKQITPQVIEVFDNSYFDAHDVQKAIATKVSEQLKVRHTNKRPQDFRKRNNSKNPANMRVRNQGRHRR